MSRSERVAELIKAEVSDILTREVSDPRIGFITITDVTITDDLKHAKIFVSVYGDESKKDATMKGLESATLFIKGELGNRLELRAVPEIVFNIDRAPERAARLDQIIKGIKEQSK
ncbi:MAG: 30S ribosome-binding factor RbfA [bacterium]